MTEIQPSFSTPIQLNNNTGLDFTAKKETYAISNNSDTLTTCPQQESYCSSNPVLSSTVSFVKDDDKTSIIGMLMEHISMLDTIIVNLDNSAKNQAEDLVKKANQVSLSFFESRRSLKTQEDKSKQWETINLVATIPLAIATFLYCPRSLSEMPKLESLIPALLQGVSFGVSSQEKLQKRELLQLKSENTLLNYQMKRAEDQQESLSKKHGDSTSNLLESMFLIGNNI